MSFTFIRTPYSTRLKRNTFPMIELRWENLSIVIQIIIQRGLKLYTKIWTLDLDRNRLTLLAHPDWCGGWQLLRRTWRVPIIFTRLVLPREVWCLELWSHDGCPCLVSITPPFLLICLCWSLFKLCSWLVFLSYGKTWPLSRSS